jgi:tetratricopeptide (TPR) repeat protein
MPLGILLAAGWVDLLTLDEITSEITRSVDFLETELRDVPERHHSLRAAFEYSWQLLSEEERTGLASMSVFRGGFTRHAAQTVAGVSLRSLNILAHKSLLQRDPGSPRYFLHEQIRQFAEGKLEDFGIAENIRESHSHYYLVYLAESGADLKGNRQLDALDEIEDDFENIRIAWSWAVKNKAEAILDNALESLHLFTIFRSHFTEGYELFQQARRQWLASDETASSISGRLLIRYIDPDQDPNQVYQLGLEIARQHDRPTDIAYALKQLGAYLAHTGSDYSKGMSLLEESLSIYRDSGDDYAVAKVLDDIAFGYGLIDQSQRMFYGQESLAIRRRIGDWIGVANVLRNLAVAAIRLGKPGEAYQYMDEALSIAQQMSDLNSIGWMYLLQALGSLVMGDFTGGEKLSNEAFRISREIHDQDLTRNCLIVRSLFVTVVEEDYVKAKQLLVEANLFESQKDMLWWSWTVYALVASSLGDLQEAVGAILFVLRQMKQGGINLGAYSYFVVAIALAFIQLGKAIPAAECLGYYDNIPTEGTAWGNNWPPLKRLRDDLVNQLGHEDFDSAMHRGRNLTVKTIESHLETG